MLGTNGQVAFAIVDPTRLDSLGLVNVRISLIRRDLLFVHNCFNFRIHAYTYGISRLLLR